MDLYYNMTHQDTPVALISSSLINTNGQVQYVHSFTVKTTPVDGSPKPEEFDV